MDPLTCLGLAANIATFVDFACKLVSGSHAICTSSSGLSDKNASIQAIAVELTRLTEEFTVDKEGSSPSLQALARQCKAVAGTLLMALDGLKTKKPGKKWSSFQAALKEIWQGTHIKELQEQLQRLQAAVHLQLTADICDPISDISNRLNALEKRDEQLEMKQTEQIIATKGEITSAIAELGSKLETERLKINGSRFEGISESFFDGDTTKLSLGMQTIPANLSQLAEESNRVSEEQGLLLSLSFKSMEARHTEIALAHRQTLEWIYKDDDSKGGQFGQWLEHGNGMFWVSGKAGSGKSTLMRFASEHERTKSLLLNWANPFKLVIAKFFFWNSGTELQKSQDGLLQTLLFEILRSAPELIPSALKAKGKQQRWAMVRNYNIHWDRQLLLACLHAISAESGTTNRLCLFVDGLDEYQTQHRNTLRDLIAMLKGLIEPGTIKICVSSRPWNIFRDELGQDPKLLLQLEDLTKDDIRKYVDDEFDAQPLFRKLKTLDPSYSQLVQELLNKAQGVFLWVSLVVPSLLEGLSNADCIDDLRRRLETIPGDLEGFYERILESVDKPYQDQMSKYLRLAIKSDEAIPLMIYSLLGEGIKAMDRPTPAWLEVRLESSERRLDACCKGLLEVVIQNQDHLTTTASSEAPALAPDSISPNNRAFFQNVLESDGDFLQFRVVLLHQTVKDFLRSEDGKRWLKPLVADDFDANIFLCESFLSLVRLVKTREYFPPQLARDPMLLYSFSGLFRFALRIEQRSQKEKLNRLFLVLDEFERFYESLDQRSQHFICREALGQKEKPPSLRFLYMCTMSKLAHYTAWKIADRPWKYKDIIAPSLHALTEKELDDSDLPILGLLLDRWDPNETCVLHSVTERRSLWNCCWTNMASNQDRVHAAVDDESQLYQAKVRLLLACSHMVLPDVMRASWNTFADDCFEQLRNEIGSMLEQAAKNYGLSLASLSSQNAAAQPSLKALQDPSPPPGPLSVSSAWARRDPALEPSSLLSVSSSSAQPRPGSIDLSKPLPTPPKLSETVGLRIRGFRKSLAKHLNRR